MSDLTTPPQDNTAEREAIEEMFCNSYGLTKEQAEIVVIQMFYDRKKQQAKVLGEVREAVGKVGPPVQVADKFGNMIWKDTPEGKLKMKLHDLINELEQNNG